MNWNFRVVKKTWGGESGYCIQEVYCNGEDLTSKPLGGLIKSICSKMTVGPVSAGLA